MRYNRGGHVSPLLLEKLARKRVGYDVSRYGPPQPYPPESVAGPMVAITNQFAGSDGDISRTASSSTTSARWSASALGAGSIGINPYHELVDGTMTTQPEYSFWFIDVGWGVENYGTDPDVEVDIAPQDYRGRPRPADGLRVASHGWRTGTRNGDAPRSLNAPIAAVTDTSVKPVISSSG